MSRAPRRVFDIDGHLHFVTFSCYHRLPLLSRDRCKQIVLGQMNVWSGRNGVGIVGFVVMPNHVHALVRPISAGRLSTFLENWKGESSLAVSEYLQLATPQAVTPFAKRVIDAAGAVRVWQSRSYCFNVFTQEKVIEKLTYMHNNPVKKGLVTDPCDWQWSSARHFLKGQHVGVRLIPYDGPLPEWLSANACIDRQHDQ